MDNIKIEVTGNIARVIERPSRITSGTVGVTAEFSFDSKWTDLAKTAVFRTGHVSKVVCVIEDKITVPWELLQNPGVWLSVGVYGENADGSIVIPTIWANVCVISKGTTPEGDPSIDPTPSVWAKMLNSVESLWKALGVLLKLKTTAKDNLVDAINEVYDGVVTEAKAREVADSALNKGLSDHVKNSSNPHSITAEQVGARPSTWLPTIAEIGAAPATHATNKENPHGVTASQVGLGNVNNTSDSNKPVSTAQATAIADAKAAGTTAQTSLNSHTSNKSNPHGVTASQLGLKDYVIDQGPSGIWRYRKWNSGFKECWCEIVLTNVACTTPFGSLYESPAFSIGDLPFPFESQPGAVINYVSDPSNSGAMIEALSAASTNYGGSYYLCRATSATTSGKVYAYYWGV